MNNVQVENFSAFDKRINIYDQECDEFVVQDDFLASFQIKTYQICKDDFTGYSKFQIDGVNAESGNQLGTLSYSSIKNLEKVKF
ncbi:hypothetical protein [uncultured Tateyamaria sp.]|uniref:hypothetical protein n=1 Tax=uncultured Tateyamaria sp. TaxID=455651 RepID=UPI002614DFDA|nr:hypothetical protein [uncultured Tateyamaria sp.]